MAKGQERSVLEREVTCGLCLGLLKEPKKLPCDHIYCKECLRGLAIAHSLNSTVTCPEYCTTTQIPNNDVSNLPTAFHVNRIMEAFQQTQSVSEDEIDLPNTIGNCQTHHKQPLAMYCETCKKQICRDCVLTTQDHATHKYGFFKEVADEYRRKINSEFELVRSYKLSISRTLEEVKTVQSDMDEQEKHTKKEIDITFEELPSVLQKWRDELTKKPELHYLSAATIRKSQEDQLEKALSELSMLKATVDDCIQDDDDQATITNADSVLMKISSTHRKLQTTLVSVAKSQPLALQYISTEAFKHHLMSECFLHRPASSDMCYIEDLSVLDRVETAHETIIILHLLDSTGKECLGWSNSVVRVPPGAWRLV